MDRLHQLVPRGLYMEPVLPAGINPNNLTAVAEYYVTHRIPQRFNPGIVVASIAVSALGSYSTLLVLGKRTSNKGKKNIFLLSLAATTMAAVGIWGMHFIGMHMSLRPVAGVNWYIKVDPGFTVLSLFVPIIALHAAFFIVDAAISFSFIRTTISGVLTGLIVSLMHYSASLKTNYAVSYSPTLVTISIVVACVASTVALTGFFKFRSQWEDSWWKRMICAFVLAAAVSGMHYIGVWGTSYKVKASTITGMNEISLLIGRQRNNILVIAIGCMCFVIICFSIFIAVSDMLIVRDARRKSKKVVVCSATFDKQGRLLVKPDGTMPLMIIETDVNTRDILDALDNRQPTFQWLYSLSWDWAIISPWLRAITSRFAAESQNAQSNEALWKSRGKKMIAQGRRSLDISDDRRKGPQSLADFRDRFIDAAYHLAHELDIPFEEIGVLYDHVLPTGTRSEGNSSNPNNLIPDKFTPSRQFADDESSINGPVPSIFGEGNDQEEGAMLFLVRELPNSAASTERFRQMGYRMTETRFLAGVLADRVAVQKDEMEPLLDSLKVYAKRGTRPVVQPGGVYCGLFGVRASTSKEGGLDVLVYNFARHQIPAYRLPDVQCITPEMKTFLGSLDQATMEDAMKVCERESIRSGERRKYLQSISSVNVADNQENEAEQEAVELMIQFQTALFIALDALHNSVRFYPKICQTARISAEVLEVPSSLDDSTAPAEMILVQAVLPEARTMPASYSASEGQHAVSEVVPTDKPNSATPFVFVPYTLFSKSQMMLLRGRQADDFEHEVILEMRRRYPSSLQSEAEEKGLFEAASPRRISHKESFISAGRFNTKKYAGSDDDDKLETSSKFSSDDNPASPITNKFSVLPSTKRWGNGARRGSKEDGFEQYEQQQQQYQQRRADGTTALSPGRRQSITSSRSRQTNEDHEMRQLNDGPLSRADSMSSRKPVPSVSGSSVAGGNNMNSSLGVRRFIQGQEAAQQSRDGRLVHTMDDVITEEGQVQRDGDLRSISPDCGEKETSYPPTSPYPAQPPQPSQPSQTPQPPQPRTLTEASNLVFGQGQSRSAARPSTAPANVIRREPNLLRPSSSGAQQQQQRALPVSQRQRRNRTAISPGVNPSHQDEGSLHARLQSDGWHARQIQSLERSPAGTALLGVDF
ncbi:hypothetical protein NDA10_006039 [Ustilago hordei]|uniref:MHYT domain-containing protein n=1 Tax=Ustilago hordei TaxID=120017 RepID=I2FNS9_USTHO|nr:uncharacterized protein UHO2_07132 [Ustilago hordei]KAJ1039555.1 hypothetical protein NDA10_006039 [Ustilago hordei]UTT92895.1 hypothetical protein NDA17_002704 [Ustilago hordei]CCF48572.1 uncharacterized protein UHOR_03361 [Ustilago hordei]SYW85179.1 uncharacterized protein UHO2_07132 [Ustilago hordei]